MAKTTITIRLKVAWWLKHYIYGVSILGWLMQREPNWGRVDYWVRKAISIKALD